MISKNTFLNTPDFEAGEVILIDKYLDWTSFDVVRSIQVFIKYNYGIKKVKIGHAGTLDPRATGLMIICTGRKTKEIDQFQDLEKEYTGTFHVGKTTLSFDTETLPDKEFSTSHISDSLLVETALKFTGDIEQLPPKFSAIKIQGKKAYEFARKNKEVNLQKRPVNISRFDIEGVNLPDIMFRINCSKGTYIRALANDFGEALGSGAYLATLRRTGIGPYRVEDALTIDEFKEKYRVARDPRFKKSVLHASKEQNKSFGNEPERPIENQD